MERKEELLGRIGGEVKKCESELNSYFDNLTIKRNRTSLILTSFMHNVVNI